MLLASLGYEPLPGEASASFKADMRRALAEFYEARGRDEQADASHPEP